MLPVSATGLYWSIRGMVLCATHASELDPAQLEAERWTALPETSQGFRGTWYQCKKCAPDGIVRVIVPQEKASQRANPDASQDATP